MKKNFAFASLFVLVFVAWLLYPKLLASNWAASNFPKANWQVRGTIGDSYGALNTLFSGLALAGLALNLYIQGSQLRKLEKKEADNERQLAAQATALRLTALLNFYNKEMDRLDRIYDRMTPTTDEKVRKKFWDKYAEVIKKRSAVVRELTGSPATEIEEAESSDRNA